MMAQGQTFRRLIWQPLAISLVFVLSTAPLRAAELKLEVKLIWGTDDPKYSDPKHKEVDPATAEKFRKCFKWKRYFEINRQTGLVPSRAAKAFKMSEKCTIEITELEGPKIEVKLIGDGKPVNKTTEPLSKGKWITLGGDDKNGSAWFIVITDLDEK